VRDEVTLKSVFALKLFGALFTNDALVVVVAAQAQFFGPFLAPGQRPAFGLWPGWWRLRVVVLDGLQGDGRGGRGRPLMAFAAPVLLVQIGASEFFAALLAPLFLDVLEEVGDVLAGHLKVAVAALVRVFAHLVKVREGVAKVDKFVVLLARDAHAACDFLHAARRRANNSTRAADSAPAVLGLQHN
jgi:hypothetical protein